jgi:hypothetical protein
MLERLLLSSPWLAMALGAIILATDYYTSIYQTHFYQAGVRGYLEYQDLYKLTLEIDAVIARRRIISGRFAASVGVLVACIVTVWWLCLQQSNRPEVFLFLIGGFVLDEAAEIIRQYRHIMVWREVLKRGGLDGKLSYTRRLTYMQTVYDRYGFVLLYAFLFLVTGSWFIFGGAFACFATSRHFRDWVVVKA